MLRADALIEAAQAYAATSHGRDVMILMGTDFTYSNALTWYKNMDRLIAAINRGGRATAEYSNPERYLAAKAAAGGAWPLRTDDLFPYADSPHTYWTGALPRAPQMRRCTPAPAANTCMHVGGGSHACCQWPCVKQHAGVGACTCGRGLSCCWCGRADSLPCMRLQGRAWRDNCRPGESHRDDDPSLLPGYDSRLLTDVWSSGVATVGFKLTACG